MDKCKEQTASTKTKNYKIKENNSALKTNTRTRT